MRDGSRQGVLERIDDKKEKIEEKSVIPIATSVIPRPLMVEGVTYQTETPVGKTYITINHDLNKEPFEVFITVGKSGSDVAAMADALGRMISLNLRLNGQLSSRDRIKQVVAQLIGIGGARSVGFGENKVRSLPDAVAKVLSRHFEFRVNGVVEDRVKSGVNGNGVDYKNGAINAHVELTADGVEKKQTDEIIKLEQLVLQTQEGPMVTGEGPTTGLYDICPECGGGSLAYEEGCKKCYACGYSEC
jgi:ribonucleoside-diphosphate reductase alpha chain